MTATEPLPSQCPKCAATRAALYRDVDGGCACLICGWHGYDRRPAPSLETAGRYNHELRRWLGADGRELAA